jgi:hypothetical protein
VRARAILGAAVLGGLACAERPRAEPAGRSALPSPPADSLVATAAGGTEVWFTLARPDSAEGRRCVDRGLEIRRGATRLPVPLLYTGTAPEILNDTMMRARLSSHCRPGDPYLVDLRTGRPVRERP